MFRISSPKFFHVSFGLLLLALSSAALAQSPRASIRGVVSDPQGAVIPGATVSATNIQTGIVTTAQTNEVGLYSLPLLPIGQYILKAEASGFRRYVRQNITLTTGQALELRIVLEVGQLTESVTVSAEAPLLETRTADAGQLVEARTVEDMPLGDRRAMNMVNILGAAVFVNYDSGSKPNFSLAGGRTQSQMFWIDGGTAQNMRLGVGQVDLDPPVETVQEMKVLSNNYAAEYGGSAGGVIIATTKSGTNEFRGSAFEYLRNEKLDAADFFAPIQDGKKTKPSLRYNVFGGTIGGPIIKEKTFFLFAYEGSRRRDGFVRTMTVPTELEKSGDFSQTLNNKGQLVPIFDPATTVQVGNKFVRTQFPDNIIPPSRFDPVAVKVLDFYPVANRPPDTLAGANNFRANWVRGLTRNNFTVKIDHNLGDKHKLSGRYLYNSDDTDNTSVFPDPAAETNNDTERHQQYWYGSWTWLAKPSLINEFRFTYGNRINHAFSKGLGGNWPSKLGIKGVPDDAFPQFSPSGYQAVGSNNQERRQFPIEQYQIVNNLSWIRGKHSFKFGAEVRPAYNYEINRPQASGSFSFSTLPTGQPGNAATGNGLATMLLGFPTGFTARETEVLDRSSWYLSWFAQDEWNVHPDLTLNYGVRWETDTPIVDANDRMNGFDRNQINPVSGTPGVVKFAGVNGWRTDPYDTDWDNFAPRFGFAWKPFGSRSWVVRGGYGIFYAHPFDHGAPSSASLGYELSATLNTPDNGITAPFYLKDGVPGLDLDKPPLDDSFGAVPVGKQATTNVTFYESDRRTGYSQQFNLGIQRELPGRMMVEVSYIGNLSRKLASSNLPINQILPERMGPGTSQKDRPYPQFSNVQVVLPSLGVSSYHAGMVKIEKRFSGGLNFLGTYTWSKFMNNCDEGGANIGEEGSPYSDYYNRRADWGFSENDITHRFTWSSVYEIPVGKGRQYLTDSPLRHILGDWSIGSVVLLRSGAPFTVATRVNTTYSSSAGALRADMLRDPNLPPDQRTVERWFDTEAFAQPAPYTFGNQGVNMLRMDGQISFDFSILRNFNLRENWRLQFRGEMFNAFNHPNFGVPGRTFDGPGFGVVSSASAGRQIQFGLRLTF